MRAIAQTILWAAEIYLAVGVVLAAGFAAVGVRRVLPEAGDITLGARLIVLPAATLLWPVALYRWRNAR
jgi:hypothetical protein